MSNTTLTHYLNSEKNQYRTNLNHKKLQKTADQNALSLFKKAAKSVPAYQDFLKKNRIKPANIKSIKDFQKVPPTTKNNYVFKYDLNDRCWNGDLTKTHAFSASSGTTGEPTFWPRQLKQEVEGATIHEYLLLNIFSIHQKSTLTINAYGLGNWIAGMFTHASLYLNRLHYLPFTLATPGYNQEEIFKVIRNFASHYEQTLLICHPPVTKMLIETGQKAGINWPEYNLKFLGSAEGFSENWRDYLLSLVGATDPYRTFINIYGSADAGLMGFETPLSIALHRLTSTDHKLNQKLFKNERNPYLYQYDPTIRYLESIDDEITITMDATMPLIRYNIKDHGSVQYHEDFIKTINQSNPDSIKQIRKVGIDPSNWPLPFVYIFGRDQFMITLYGVNIYPENLKAVVDDPQLQPHLTGRFITQKRIDNQQDQYLQIRLELKPNIKPAKKLKQATQKVFLKTLKKLNSEYSQVEQEFGEKMHPHLKFHRYHHPKYFPEGKTRKMG